MNQKILVTGLSGLVGSRFEALSGKTYQMINLDLTNGVDITNESQVDQVFQENKDAIGVIHLAAFTNLNAAAEQNGDKSGVCYRVNVTGSEIMAKTADKYQKYLIHISTDYVFDGEKNEPYTENDLPHPIEWYGQTKAWADEAVNKLNQNHVILRLAFPYQANPSRPDMVAKIKNGLETGTLYPMFADHIITPTFVDDVALVLDYCLKHKPQGLYHMVGSSYHSDYEVALMVKEMFKLKGEVKKGSLTEYLKTTKRPYQKTMKISNEKLTQEFGIQMKTLREGLAEINK